MRILQVLLISLMLANSDMLHAEEIPTEKTKTTIFRNKAGTDFIIVSEKPDGNTEVRHIDNDSYENAINELKQNGVLSICS